MDDIRGKLAELEHACLVNNMLLFSSLSAAFPLFFKKKTKEILSKKSILATFPLIMIASFLSFLPSKDLMSAFSTCKMWFAVSHKSKFAFLFCTKKTKRIYFKEKRDQCPYFLHSEEFLLFRGTSLPTVIDRNLNSSFYEPEFLGLTHEDDFFKIAWNGSVFALVTRPTPRIKLTRCVTFQSLIPSYFESDYPKHPGGTDICLSRDTLFICYHDADILEMWNFYSGAFSSTDLKTISSKFFSLAKTASQAIVFSNEKLHFIRPINPSKINLGDDMNDDPDEEKTDLVYCRLDTKSLQFEQPRYLTTIHYSYCEFLTFFVEEEFLLLVLRTNDYFSTKTLLGMNIRQNPVEHMAKLHIAAHCQVALWNAHIFIYDSDQKSIKMWDRSFRNCREINAYENDSVIFKFK